MSAEFVEHRIDFDEETEAAIEAAAQGHLAEYYALIAEHGAFIGNEKEMLSGQDR